MSRQAASKSRLEKGRGGLSAPTPTITKEIVPGKFSDLDWTFALDTDDNSEFVFDIVNEIADSALSIIYDNYLEKQLVPYTVALAKDAMLTIVEWHFLKSDSGESPNLNTEQVWLEDDEPPCCLVDAWGQGCIPLQVASPRPNALGATQILGEIEEEQVDANDDMVSEEPLLESEAVQILEPTTATLSEAVDTSDEKITAPSVAQEVTQTSRQSNKPSTKAKAQRHRGKLQSAHVSKMTETLYETELRQRVEELRAGGWQLDGEEVDQLLTDMPASCHSILKVQMGRPPGNKEVVYDVHGNVMSVVKIPPEQLPSHQVKVNYRVVDPEVEAANRRMDAMRRGNRYGTNSRQPGAVAVGAGRTPTHTIIQADVQTLARRNGEGLSEPLPPSLIDTINLSAGVMLREGIRVKKGPRQLNGRRSDALNSDNLRPLQVHASTHAPMSVEQLMPQIAIRPLGEVRPIPPISGQQ